MKSNRSEARAHHFVPQFWLAGFTDTGKKIGRLWVTDFKRKKQWQCKPADVGYRRDFYRVDESGISDPLVIEKLYSTIESQAASVFRLFCADKRGPRDGTELGTALEYLAIQWTRLPTFRAALDRTVLSLYSKAVLANNRSHQTGLHERRPPPNPQCGAGHARLVDSIGGSEMKFSARPAFYIQYAAKFLGPVYECLKQLRWYSHVSEGGDFLASDSPVILHGTPGQPGGFMTAQMVTYPLNRHVLLVGAREGIAPPVLTAELVARHNTLAMMNADEQVYAHRSDFVWLSDSGKCQSDWTLFSKSDSIA